MNLSIEQYVTYFSWPFLHSLNTQFKLRINRGFRKITLQHSRMHRNSSYVLRQAEETKNAFFLQFCLMLFILLYFALSYAYFCKNSNTYLCDMIAIK